MKTFFIVLITFLTKAGTLTNQATNQHYILKCSDSDMCYFSIDLPIGFYTYISEDKKDTTLFYADITVQDRGPYKTSGNFYFIP